MKLLIFTSLALIVLIGASSVGVAGGQAGFMLGWLCLSPIVLPLWGIGLYRAFQGRRVVALSEREFRGLQKARMGATQSGG